MVQFSLMKQWSLVIIFAVVAAILLLAFFAMDNNTNPSPESVPVASAGNFSHRVKIETDLGEIIFETYDSDAPKAVGNFVSLAEKGFYNGVIFHRVIPGFMIQGGDPSGNGTGGPGYTFADELDPSTPSAAEGYRRGVVAMANAGPNTNGSQFFIMHADYPLPHQYTIFGKVISGMETVDKIAELPRDGNDRPFSPPAMRKVSVEQK